MSEQHECALCLKPVRMMCGKCFEPYCSVTCQRKDWQKHKNVCTIMPKLVSIPSTESIDNNITDLSIPKRSKYQPTNVDGISTSVNTHLQQFFYRSVNPIKQTDAQFQVPRPIVLKREEIPCIDLSNVEDAVNESHMLNGTLSKQDAFRAPFDKQPLLRQTHTPIERPTLPCGTNNLSTKSNAIACTIQTTKSPRPQMEANILASGLNSNAYNIETLKLSTKPVDNTPAAPAAKNIDAEIGANWRIQFPIETRDAVMVVVQFVDELDPSILWVILKTNEEACNSLLTEINESIDESTVSCLPDMIKVNNMVAAPFDGMYYRAIILKTFTLRPLKQVYVRLIDYGNEIYLKHSQVKPPTPTMYALHMFAFQVKLSEPRPIEIGDTITIQLCNCESNGMWIAKEIAEENLARQAEDIAAVVADYMGELEQEKPDYPVRADIETIPIPENVPLKMVILDSSKLIEKLTVTAAMLDENLFEDFSASNSKMSKYCCDNSTAYGPNVNEICCALFEDDMDWYRAECLKVLPGQRFLVRFLDYGNMCELNAKDIRKLPKEHMYATFANECVIETGFLSMVNAEDLQKIDEFLQTNNIYISCAKKIGSQYNISVIGIAELFSNN